MILKRIDRGQKRSPKDHAESKSVRGRLTSVPSSGHNSSLIMRSCDIATHACIAIYGIYGNYSLFYFPNNYRQVFPFL